MYSFNSQQYSIAQSKNPGFLYSVIRNSDKAVLHCFHDYWAAVDFFNMIDKKYRELHNIKEQI